MDHRFHRLTSATALATLALGVAAACGSAAASFPDPVGDVKGGGGPDLTSVSVSHTATAVTFRLRFAKAPPLGMSVRKGWGDMLIVGLDVPPRGLKRGPQGWTGADYYVGVHATETIATLIKPSPAGRGTVVAHPRVAVAGRTLSFSVSRRVLGDPGWLEFAVAVGREMPQTAAAAGGSDEAPAHGAFHYRLGT